MRGLCLSIAVLFLMVNPEPLKADSDAEGCKDYPMFSRMPNYNISACEVREFDAYDFPVANSTDEDCKKQRVEGKFISLAYNLNEGAMAASALQIFRNFETALKNINATIVAMVVESGNAYSFITARVTKNNKETWVLVQASGDSYSLTIVEKEAMVQSITANEMLDALNKDGFIALNILFDTGKSTIKPESQAIVDQIYELLKSNPSLKVSIEGHTDNVGTPESNKTLSAARAKAVMDALVAKGIDKNRLSSIGWGQEKPVADNRNEEGRAKNRRVEIVKK